MTLAGSGGTGDFQVENQTGSVTVGTVGLDVANAGVTDRVSYRGIYAGGAVTLENGARPITFGRVQRGSDQTDETLELVTAQPSLGLTGTPDGTDLRRLSGDCASGRASVTPSTRPPRRPRPPRRLVQQSAPRPDGGSQRLAPDRCSRITSTIPGSRSPTPRSSRSSRAETAFDGDVNSGATLQSLTCRRTAPRRSAPTSSALRAARPPSVTDASFSAGSHTVSRSGEFRAIDGPGSVALRGAPAVTARHHVADRDPRQRRRKGIACGVRRRRPGPFSTHRRERQDRDERRPTVGGSSRYAATPSVTVPDAATIADTSGAPRRERGRRVIVGAEARRPWLAIRARYGDGRRFLTQPGRRGEHRDPRARARGRRAAERQHPPDHGLTGRTTSRPT